MIIGRDELLKKEIYPRIKAGKTALITGQRGIGKTTLLEWAFKNYDGKKFKCSCNEAYGQILKGLAKELELEAGRKKLHEIEKEILKVIHKIMIFVDDYERMTPKLAHFLCAANCKMWLAGNDQIREEGKKLLWGMPEITLRRLKTDQTKELAEYAIQQTGAMINKADLANKARGVPGRIWALANGEDPRETENVRGEEINIAPVLLLLVAGIFIFKYFAMGSGEKELYLLGGCGMGASLLLRFIIFRAGR